MTHAPDGDLIVFLDDKSFDFSAYVEIRPIAKLFADYMRFSRSKGSSASARQKTNKTTASRLNSFLKFALPRRIDYIDEDVCRQYIDYLRERYKPKAEWNAYRELRKAINYGFEMKVLADFAVPRGIAKTKADAMRGQTQTLADLHYNKEADHRRYNELNRILLRLLGMFCWQRVYEIRDRQRQGYAWRAESADDAASLDICGSKSREQHLRYIVRRYWTMSNGYTGFHAKKAGNHATRTEVGNYLRHHGLDISWAEIHDHLKITSLMQGPFMCIYAMERLNSEMIMALRYRMLQDDPLDPVKKRIVVPKGRANTEEVFGRLAVGGENARTIPQAWAIQKEIQDRTFGPVPDDDVEMFKVVAMMRDGAIETSIRCASNTMKELQSSILSSKDAQYEPLRRLKGQINLQLIRNTVINVDRRSKSFAATVKLAGHKSGTTTAIYLRNPSTRDAYEEEIERGQRHFFEIVEAAKLVLPSDDPTGLAAASGLSVETAQGVIDDDFNLGYGLSLVNDKTFVLCSPLNYLRMETWVGMIERAQDRLERDNPERWTRVWRPQLSVFRQALQDFPRKIAKQAMELRDRIDLHFPEPY